MPYTYEFPYSKFTQRMANLLPSWMKIRRDKHSIGQQFLNFFGLQFEHIESMLEDMLNSSFLPTASVEQIDSCFKTKLPDVLNPNWQLSIYADHHEIPVADKLKDFYLATEETAYIDWQSNMLYLRYTGSEVMVSGSQGSKRLAPMRLKMSLHQIWNAFDEFGLLLDTPRFPGEPNIDYKERLYYVFRYPASARKLGILHGLGRHLGLFEKLEWTDDSSPLLIPKRLHPETIRVDGRPYDNIQYSESQTTLLPPDSPSEASRIVTYLPFVQLHALFDWQNDKDLYNLLFEPNGQATDLHRRYAQMVHEQSPIFWDYFKYDEAYWDVVKPDKSGLSYVPNNLDADISAWKDVDLSRFR